VDLDLDKEGLLKLSSDTVKWELEFNKRAGFTKADDRIPEYFREVHNPANNCVFDVSDEELDKVHL